jgi:threonine/homoserine/homoserine lactone efflux protein
MLIQTFLVAFIFSFLGSIPPGTINVSVAQLSLNKQFGAATRFAIAAALIEYPYVLIAVYFEQWITSSPVVIGNFQIIGGSVMLFLGILNLWSYNNPSKLTEKFRESGFRKGLLISIANPLAIPFWIGVTAYLRSNEWINTGNNNIYIYALAISIGTFTLLMLVALLAKKVAPILQHNQLIRKLPGWIFILLGLYTFGRYFTSY